MRHASHKQRDGGERNQPSARCVDPGRSNPIGLQKLPCDQAQGKLGAVCEREVKKKHRDEG